MVIAPGAVSTKDTGLPRNHRARSLTPLTVQSCRGSPLPGGLTVEGRLRVVVVEGHRLAAAVDDRLLGERSRGVADRRAGAVGPAVDPGLVDPAALVVRVALEIIRDHEIGHGEAPDSAFPRAARHAGIDFIDPPEVRLAPLQSLRGEAGVRLAALIDAQRIGRRGILHGAGIGAEVHIVLGGVHALGPGQRRGMRFIRRGLVRRLRITGQVRVARHDDLDFRGRQGPVVDANVVEHAAPHAGGVLPAADRDVIEVAGEGSGRSILGIQFAIEVELLVGPRVRDRVVEGQGDVDPLRGGQAGLRDQTGAAPVVRNCR